MFNPSRAFGHVAKTGLVAAVLALTATASSAQSNKLPKDDIWIDIGSVERVDFAGRMEMLSQRIAASTCNLEAGILPDISRGLLAGSNRELGRVMAALRYGNPLMKIIGEETNPRILEVYGSLENDWLPVQSTVAAMLEQSESPEDFQVVHQWNMPFRENAELLLSEIAAEYSDPAELLQRDVILVDLASRQRTRTQMILKQSCEIWKDGGTQEEKDALLETVQIFDKTLEALRFGADDVGIKEAPTSLIEAKLTAMASEWGAARLTLATVAQGRRVSDSAIEDLYLSLNEMLIQSEGIVAEYAKFSKPTY